MITDNGFQGRGYHDQLAADGVTLPTTDKDRSAANAARERALDTNRLVIESVFASLKGQMLLANHLVRTPAGPAVRIAQRSLVLTVGMLLNTPPAGPHTPSPAFDDPYSHPSPSWSLGAPAGGESCKHHRGLETRAAGHTGDSSRNYRCGSGTSSYSHRPPLR